MLQISRHDPIRPPLHRLPINQIIIPHHHIHRPREPISLIFAHRRNILLALEELLRILKALHMNLTAPIEIQHFESLERCSFLLVFGVKVVLLFIVGQWAMLIVAGGREKGLYTWIYLVLYAAKAFEPTARSA